MITNEAKIQNIYLKPGEIFITKSPSFVSTVLGSCVSVTMFCRRKEIGGICHAVFPRKNGSGERNGLQFVDYSLQKMVDSFSHLKVEYSNIEVKLFGGSELPEADKKESRTPQVGKQNINEVLRFLEEKGLNLIASDTGGFLGRKIVFHTHTGEVFLKRLREKGCKTVLTAETKKIVN